MFFATRISDFRKSGLTKTAKNAPDKARRFLDQGPMMERNGSDSKLPSHEQELVNSIAHPAKDDECTHGMLADTPHDPELLPLIPSSA